MGEEEGAAAQIAGLEGSSHQDGLWPEVPGRGRLRHVNLDEALAGSALKQHLGALKF